MIAVKLRVFPVDVDRHHVPAIAARGGSDAGALCSGAVVAQRRAVTSDGAVLCHHCVRAERTSIGTTTGRDGWCVVAIEANWEDPELYCAHCSSRIESAYAEPESAESETSQPAEVQ